jgi:hypothetical protein
MGSAWETLRETVASLSETEAVQALDYIRRLRGAETNRPLAALLADDPSIRLPDRPFDPLPPLEPARGSGIPASELLIRDRR